ncbi:hypothetical protein AMTR_s00105p00047330 [Amborella trichopoda]|uniref:Uncharacterized protein n=1 Tax=Amborella trichopoda TaxID=13333 RepID=W1NSF4_AMBTC|nr:hypothetical protein AMTR_s00105p00047330 [Amborella trichopoda]
MDERLPNQGEEDTDFLGGKLPSKGEEFYACHHESRKSNKPTQEDKKGLYEQNLKASQQLKGSRD